MDTGTSSESETETNIEALYETLGTERVDYVDSVNDDIADLVENSPELENKYIVGEVSDYGTSSNGHVHFDLVHRESTIHCVIYAYKLEWVDVDDLDSGIEVAVEGELSYYVDGGNISILVDDYVDLGEGSYQQVYEENAKILEEAGLLAEDTKQPLPELPSTVGVATSGESDARTDTVTSIHNRHPGVDIVIRDTTVQGSDAMMSLIQAIGELDQHPDIDVIVVTRGGGSDKDLRVFNETPLCRVIHGTETPVVVGVGHENDRTLADEVADRRVMTPTHVGEIVPQYVDLQEEHTALANRLQTAYTRTITSDLDNFEERLDIAYTELVANRLSEHQVAMDDAYVTLCEGQLQEYRSRLNHELDKVEQTIEHKEQAAEFEKAQRRQKRIIAALVILLLLVLGYVFAWPL